MIGPAQQDASYRRGLVLGLTMAEIAILIIFCLLLLLGTLLLAERDRTRIAEEKARHTGEQFAVLQEKFEKLSNAIGAKENIQDLFRELVLIREEAAALANEVGKLKEAQLVDQQIIGLLQGEVSAAEKYRDTINTLSDALDIKISGDDGSSSQKLVEAIVGKFEEADQLINAAEAAGLDAADSDELPKIISSSLETRAENSNLRGQIEQLRSKLDAVGKGTEMPSCLTQESGKTEYLFDVNLFAGGFSVYDRTLSENLEILKMKLPLDMITLGQRVSAERFLDETRPVFDWSKEQQCRFFVRLFDRTGPTEKGIYKRMMRILEMHFYKFEVLNG
jgi:hypothetical protein